jgi:hypothetical protein
MTPRVRKGRQSESRRGGAWFGVNPLNLTRGFFNVDKLWGSYRKKRGMAAVE